MANKIKEGLDYFPLDSDFYNDRKIRKLLKKFQADGIMVYSYLLCEVYRDKGYFIKWDDDLAFDIADRLHIGEELVHAVINYCIEVSLFDKTRHERFNILTSYGIQKRYMQITKRRNNNILTNYRIDGANDQEQPEKDIEEKPVQCDDKDLVNDIMGFFGFNEVAHFDRLREVNVFVNLLHHKERNIEFKGQFQAYKEYKELRPNESIHSLTNFINGGWESNNWEYKLNRIKNATSGQNTEDPNAELKKRLGKTTATGN